MAKVATLTSTASRVRRALVMRSANFGQLSLLALILALPLPARAATPTFGPGFTPLPDDPPVGVLGGAADLVAIGGAIGGLALAITAVVVLGRLLASIGRRGDRLEHHGDRALGSRPSRAGQIAGVGVAIGCGVVGIGLGIAAGDALSSRHGGGFAVMGALLIGYLVGGVVIGLVSIGLVALRFRHGHASGAIKTVFAAAGFLAMGAIGGAATARIAESLYVPPRELMADAWTAAELDATSIPFVPLERGLAECRSMPDSRVVESITGFDLGELGPGTIRGTVSLDQNDPGTAHIELLVDGADLGEGAFQPFWIGQAEIVERTSDGSIGRILFENLLLQTNPDLPAPKIAWDAALSGRIDWRCQAWDDLGPAG